MMQPCIGEKHPRAEHPVDQIKKQTSVGGKPVSAFSLPQSLKGGDLMPTFPSASPFSKRSVSLPLTGFMACLSFIHEQPKERQKDTESR